MEHTFGFSPLSFGNKKEKTVEGSLEKAKKLTEFCATHGNPVNIIEPGENFEVEKIEKEELHNMDKIKRYLHICKGYLNGPIFLDSFSEDHKSRRDWEMKYESEESMGQDIRNYYKANRLGINNCSKIVGFLDLLIDHVEDPMLNEKLKMLEKEIFEKAGDIVEKEEGFLKYHKLDDDKKINAVQELSKIVGKLVATLENKDIKQNLN